MMQQIGVSGPFVISTSASAFYAQKELFESGSDSLQKCLLNELKKHENQMFIILAVLRRSA